MKTVHISGSFDWQEPVITEKQAFDCLEEAPLPKTDITYLAIPWANVIDSILWSEGDNKLEAENILKQISQLDKGNYFTICQHYRYSKILPTLSRIGTKVLFSPHAEKKLKTPSGFPTAHVRGDLGFNIKIEPFPLYSVNVSDPTQDKNILYSFIGAYNESYISDIRDQIFEDEHPEDCIVIKREGWQFNDVVYSEQIGNERLTNVQVYLSHEKTKYYNRILGKSRFSLCPSGAGPSSIRFFESLGSGSIPVLMADTFMLPKVNAIDWDKCIVQLPESKYGDLRKILSKISPEREVEMRANCVEAFKYLSNDNFVQCIRDYYE